MNKLMQVMCQPCKTIKLKHNVKNGNKKFQLTESFVSTCKFFVPKFMFILYQIDSWLLRDILDLLLKWAEENLDFLKR